MAKELKPKVTPEIGDIFGFLSSRLLMNLFRSDDAQNQTLHEEIKASVLDGLDCDELPNSDCQKRNQSDKFTTIDKNREICLADAFDIVNFLLL